MRLPDTTKRVVLHSAPWKTRRIERQMEQRLWYFTAHPDEIEGRLRELDGEWDMERILETNASSLALLGLLLGSGVNRKFYLLPVFVTGFLLLHALQGWCPPVPLFRRLGIRTQSEIELERHSLKALRGDYGPLDGGDDTPFPARALAAARR
jgi:hypothetical protein